MRSKAKLASIRHTVRLAVAMLVLFISVLQSSSGATYYALLKQSYLQIESPLVTLKNGADNVSTIYTNSTSAKISINATPSLLTYNYSLDIVNSNSSAWEIRLENSENTNIGRVNTTIILHSQSISSEQLIVSNGTLTQTNNYVNLPINETIYVGVTNLVENSPAGTTTLNVYLRMKNPNTTTYTIYEITFEFT
jgi:hypothetical protein